MKEEKSEAHHENTNALTKNFNPVPESREQIRADSRDCVLADAHRASHAERRGLGGTKVEIATSSPNATFIVGSVFFIDGGTDAQCRVNDFPSPMPIPPSLEATELALDRAGRPSQNSTKPGLVLVV